MYLFLQIFGGGVKFSYFIGCARPIQSRKKLCRARLSLFLLFLPVAFLVPLRQIKSRERKMEGGKKATERGGERKAEKKGGTEEAERVNAGTRNDDDCNESSPQIKQ